MAYIWSNVIGLSGVHIAIDCMQPNSGRGFCGGNSKRRFYAFNLVPDNQELAFAVAERVGFEPTVPCGTAVFKTAAIDHSATSP